DPDDLARQDGAALLAALTRSHARLTVGNGKATRIAVTEPAAPGAALVIDVISPDMPFIVDSVLAALRAMGGVIRLFSHPVVRVARGAVVGEDGEAVSVLHIHSDPVADTAALVAEIEATLADVARAAADWPAMLERVRRAAAELGAARGQREEAMAFLDWLTEHNFTFLGVREYRLEAG